MNNTKLIGSRARVTATSTLLLSSGLIMNYLFERHNVLAVWENSVYPVAWSDLVYPVVSFFLCVAGIVLAVGGILNNGRSFRYSTAIVVWLTMSYALVSLAMQFTQTGADRLGECAGLDQAASRSNVIPESKQRPGNLAVGCAVEIRGIFFSYYNDIFVYGVTDVEAQQLVLDLVSERFNQARTHPVQVMFYEKENWTTRQLKNGRTLGSSRGPNKLLRVVNIG